MKQVHWLMIFVLISWANISQGFEISFGSKTKEIPQWVSNPTPDDAEYIYGVGEGDALAKAVQSALNNISGKLATVVSSNISSEVTQNQGKVNSNFSEEVRTRTFDTRLSGYEVVQSASQGDNYYALVKMSRRAFVKDTMLRLKMIDDKLNNRVALASKVSKLQYYLALNEIKPDMVDATALVLLLQAAAPEFESEKYLSTYRKYQSTMNEILFQMNFRIEADPKLSRVAEIITNLLGNEKLSSTSSKSEKADAIITVSGSVQRNIVFNEFATQLRIKIQVADETGRIVNTEDHVAGGSSLSSYDASMITTTNMLAKKLGDEGALALLGLQKPQ